MTVAVFAPCTNILTYLLTYGYKKTMRNRRSAFKTVNTLYRSLMMIHVPNIGRHQSRQLNNLTALVVTIIATVHF